MQSMKGQNSRLASAGIKGTRRAKKQEVGKTVTAFNRDRDGVAINDPTTASATKNGQKPFPCPCQSRHPGKAHFRSVFSAVHPGEERWEMIPFDFRPAVGGRSQEGPLPQDSGGEAIFLNETL